MKAEPFASYEAAIERASWVRKGAAKVLFGRSAAGSGAKGHLGWENCTVELEQTGTNQNEVDFGTLSIFGTQKKHIKVLKQLTKIDIWLKLFLLVVLELGIVSASL